jgi:hypothetical protein
MAMNTRLQAATIGEQLLYTDLKIDWQALGYSLFLRVKLGSSAARDLPCNAVPAQPQQCVHITTAASFPTSGRYEAQIIAKLAGNPDRYSAKFTIDVAPNIQGGA